MIRFVLVLAYMFLFFSCSILKSKSKVNGVYKFKFLKSISTTYKLEKDNVLSVILVDYSRNEKIISSGEWIKLDETKVVVSYRLLKMDRQINDTLEIIKNKKGRIYSLQSKDGSKYYKK